MTEKELIAGCQQQQRKAQQLLFERYSPILFGLCKRYVRNHADAEDVLIDGFYKIMTQIHQYSGQGSFEGWIKRIMVNESLMHLRKQKRMGFTEEITDKIDLDDPVNIEDELSAQDILNLLEQLPPGYRTIFNMYVIEGYKHREIAEILGISINTSKSQLILAKKKLRGLLAKSGYPDSGAA